MPSFFANSLVLQCVPCSGLSLQTSVQSSFFTSIEIGAFPGFLVLSVSKAFSPPSLGAMKHTGSP